MDTIISLVVGPLVYLVVQAVKRRTGLSGLPALWLTYAVSLLAALLVLLATGGFSHPGLEDPPAFVAALLQNAALAFSVATAIYRYVREREEAGARG